MVWGHASLVQGSLWILALHLLGTPVTSCHMANHKSLPKAKRPSLRSLAEACGISYQTVSRIVNGQGHLHRPETVTLVERTASEIGYRRNLLARSMLTGRSMTVGVMLPYYTNREFNTGILEGIQSALTKEDYMALIISVDGTKEDIKHSHHLIERRVDGVIFRPHPMGESDAYLRELMRHHVPLVSVVDVEQSLKQPLDFVGVDEAAHGRMAAEHLLELGHRRIGFTRLGEARFDVPLNERHREFVATVKQAGGQVVDTPQSNSPDFDHAAVRALLAGRKRPTAVFCSVDDIALETYWIARSLGLSVPGDLSILGSANYEAGQYVDPALTTFNLHPMEIGRQAGEILLRRAAKKPEKRAVSRIHVTPRLVSRSSTAAANQ
jgi:LacI family transcriptional regulator